MKHLILRMTAITAAILSIAVLDGIVSGQTAPWTGLFTIAALLGMAAWSYSKQTKRKRLPDLEHRTSATQMGSPQATFNITVLEEKSK